MSDSSRDNASGNPHWRAPGPKLPVIPAPTPVTTTSAERPAGDVPGEFSASPARTGADGVPGMMWSRRDPQGSGEPAWVGPSIDAPPVAAAPAAGPDHGATGPLPLPTQGSTAQTDPTRRPAVPWAAIAAVSAVGVATTVGGVYAAGWSPTAWRRRMLGSR